MEEFLNEEKVNKKSKSNKVTIKIPLSDMNKKDTFVNVCVNGKVTQIKRGVEVEVDTQIKKILERAKYI